MSLPLTGMSAHHRAMRVACRQRASGTVPVCVRQTCPLHHPPTNPRQAIKVAKEIRNNNYNTPCKLEAFHALKQQPPAAPQVHTLGRNVRDPCPRKQLGTKRAPLICINVHGLPISILWCTGGAGRGRGTGGPANLAAAAHPHVRAAHGPRLHGGRADRRWHARRWAGFSALHPPLPSLTLHSPASPHHSRPPAPPPTAGRCPLATPQHGPSLPRALPQLPPAFLPPHSCTGAWHRNASGEPLSRDAARVLLHNMLAAAKASRLKMRHISSPEHVDLRRVKPAQLAYVMMIVGLGARACGLGPGLVAGMPASGTGSECAPFNS